MKEGQHQGDQGLRWNYQFADPNVSNEALYSHTMPIIHVPRGCHFGIQTVLEYEANKRRRIEQKYKNMTDAEIVELLEHHPVHAVAIPQNPLDDSKWATLENEAVYLLAIMDGHHKTRYSRRTIKQIPTMVMTVNQAVEIYFPRYHKGPLEFVKQVGREMNEALASFVYAKESLTPFPVYFFEQDGRKEVGLVGLSGRHTQVTSVRKRA